MKQILAAVLAVCLVGCGLNVDYNAQKNFCSITRYQANQDVMTATDANVITKLKGCWEWSGRCIDTCGSLNNSCTQTHSTTVETCKEVGIPHAQDMGTDQK